MRNKLVSISATTDNQIEILKKVHKHLTEVAKGSEVTSLSTEAQDQMKELFKLSYEQYETLAQAHIRKGLATPDMNLRFNNVIRAHEETFQWLFAHENISVESSLSESYRRFTSFNSFKSNDDESSPDNDGIASQHKLEEMGDAEWSVWQLDDGYEEPNQHWWYMRDETGVWIDERRVALQTKPENGLHQHYLAAGKLFIDWLSLGSRFFHILGKLGSGKSTLMKYLFKHERTKIELAQWADKCKRSHSENLCFIRHLTNIFKAERN